MSQIQVRMEVCVTDTSGDGGVFVADTSEDGGVCLLQIQMRMEVCNYGRYK